VVQHVSEVVDARRRTVEVRVRVKNEDRLLRPNSFVQVFAPAETNDAVIRVPDSSVVTEGSRPVAFVQKSAGRLEKVAVTTGRRAEGELEVLSGLKAGDTFVSRGALLLLNQVDLAD
jgi:cobalt-zinc-cadmium efflux system membrane fusion protein